MCLAIPARIVDQPNENAMAEVDILGVKRHVNLMMTPDAKVGDHVLVHAGFAIQVVDEEFAAESLSMLRQMGIKSADELAAELEPGARTPGAAAS
ncbi:MAG: HypC/HybG/HupF family hydrogenase formation chaperone [Actinobacteria bacterium]|nr:HypC/HybG/HupF family hydrogenase formation chaperone [Actinomycetota bacterium]